jgi:hypothetical protein
MVYGNFHHNSFQRARIWFSEEDDFEMVYGNFHHNSFQRPRIWFSEEDGFEMVYGKFRVIVLPPKTITATSTITLFSELEFGSARKMILKWFMDNFHHNSFQRARIWFSEEDGFEMVYGKFRGFATKDNYGNFHHNSFQRARIWFSEEDDFEMVYGKFRVIVLPPKTITATSTITLFSELEFGSARKMVLKWF